MCVGHWPQKKDTDMGYQTTSNVEGTIYQIYIFGEEKIIFQYTMKIGHDLATMLDCRYRILPVCGVIQIFSLKSSQ